MGSFCSKPTGANVAAVGSQPTVLRTANCEDFAASETPLERAGAPVLTAAWVSALSDPMVDVRMRAVATLGRMGPEAREAVQALTGALKDRDGLVREQAAVALGLIGADARQAIPALAVALQDGADMPLRRAAATALGKVARGGQDSQEAVGALTSVLNDGDEGLRVAARKALEELGALSLVQGGFLQAVRRVR